MTTAREDLAAIHTFPQLVRYLRDELDWPIATEDFEDITFDYTVEDLGIHASSAAKIQEIKRLRPLSVSQPWGIFFVKFEPKRLPVVALRRILGSVALKKRASANRSDQAAWAVADLLFISTYGDGEARQISFAHFSPASDTTELPTLKVLGWDNLDTPLHLDTVADMLAQSLTWPSDEEDTQAWRERWSSAFTLRNREVISTSRQMAIRLADLARAIRDRTTAALSIETSSGPLTRLMKAFQESLLRDLDARDFADMYAQTIAYGLLSARIVDPGSNAPNDLAAHIRTNPFLRELMGTFLAAGTRSGGGGGSAIDFDELGVRDVVELLDGANMEAVVRDFGDRNPQEDPVIHFYELFLREYDAKRRMQRGVFYTPRPVVSYIVRSVDETLRDKFGLADGLADVSTWAEVTARRPGLAIPNGVSPNQPFVQILDPATGTGTFLVEVIDLIYSTLVSKWTARGNSQTEIEALWNEYVPANLLPRLHGYELLMAPYAIAHLKIGLKLYETGYRFGNGARVRIYLTNALEPASDGAQLNLEGFLPALAHEAQAVNLVKRHQRFTVLIGNPPYANYSANLSHEARRIVDKYRSFRGVPIRERNQLQFERNIQDDFVKFISIAQDMIGASGIGVFSYITNGTMLASRSLRGLRESVTHSFSEVFELNLHGGGNEIIVSSDHDENVFDIVQSVAIHIYVRAGSSGSSEISYAEMVGTRRSKYEALAAQSVAITKWRRIEPDEENCGFTPQDDDAGHATLRLDSTFVRFGAGIKTNRDAVVIGFDDASLVESVRAFDPGLIKAHEAQDQIRPLRYRPFDVRRLFYHADAVASRSLPTMKHFVSGPNIGILCSSTWTTPDRFSVGVSREVVEMKTGTHDRGTTFFPLYRYEGLLDGTPERVHNLAPDFVADWTEATLTRFTEATRGDRRQVTGPEDVLAYLYGLFYSPEYRRRYRTSLSRGFPLVLLTRDQDLFRILAGVGDELISLHLLESPAVGLPTARFVGDIDQPVEKVSWSDATVWLDTDRTRGFEGVSEAVWNFYFGGYPVCEKWLKDRKTRTLSNQDVVHYQKIVVAIEHTLRLMSAIDEAIVSRGGWPTAFAAR